MRFFVGKGRQFEEKLQDYPPSWINLLLPSKILVIGVINDDVIAAYGIRSMLNVAVLYVKEEYRGQGIGRQMWEKAYSAARKRGIHFFTAETPFQHLCNKYGLLLFSKYNCKVIKRFEKRKTVLMVFPFTTKGNIFYVFLRIVCSMVPSNFLGQIVQLMSERTAPRVIEK